MSSIFRVSGAHARRSAASVARASGAPFEPALIDALEQRVLLSAADQFMGPLPASANGRVGVVEHVAWRGGSVEAKAGSWMVTFDDALGEEGAIQTARRVANAMGIDEATIRSVGRGRYATIDSHERPNQWAIESALRSVDGVRAIEPNAVYEKQQLPNDPLFTNQWQLDNTGQFIPGSGFGTIGADVGGAAAWDITFGSRDVIVAVIDSGIDFSHPDLAANIWRNPNETGNGTDTDGNGFVDDLNGWDFGDLDNDPSEDINTASWYGHGTFVSGIIGAVGNNGVGIAGVAWDVSILPMKIPNSNGNALLSAIVGAHDYLTMMIGEGHNIVASNNSYGAFDQAFYADVPTGFDAEKDAIERFIAAGGTFVAAAGNSAFDNDNPDFTFFPTSYNIPGLIAVAATDNNDALAGFSNYGAKTVDLGAPGVQVYSTTVGGGYGFASGTSFAAPMVVGAVALLKAHRPEASAQEVRQTLIDSVDILPTLQNRVVSGGRLNLVRALNIIGIDGPVVKRIDPGPVTGRNDPSTGLPIDTITVEFNKSIDASVLALDSASFLYAGPDGLFGTGDDSTVITIASVDINPADDKIIHISLDLTNVPQQRLLLGKYRLTLHAGTAGDPKIRDLLGNLLKGDSTGGADEVYEFEVVGVGGSLEPNDTLATATPVSFNASGKANFTGLFLGDGLHSGLDVDIFRITMPRGGLITARVDAKSLQIPSQFDSYLRLFDALGNELAFNDQFNGPDAYLDYFVSTGGTYYAAVSGFPNDDFDPTIAGSGVTQSTGNYNLALGIELVGEDRITVSDTLDAPVAVPPTGTQGTTSDSITVNDARAIRDVNLSLDLDHTFVSDLRISLISPRGTEVVVFDRHGTNGQDFSNVLFDDEAARSIITAATPYSGSYRPTNALNKFDGESAAGLWTIVINDTTALNSGVLRSWGIELTLENDIFGPFELNDTLTTARDLNEINGTGAATRNAYIGDGGFGLLDRDLFRFRVDAGTTLNALATSVADPSTGELTLATGLRLLDASGSEIKRSTPDGTLNSSIGGFVFAAGGTYYIAVSEAKNLDYDPFNVTSGTPAETTGNYTLAISVSGGVSDASHVLAGQRVRAGIDNDGTFGMNDAGSPLGIRFDGLEFLRDANTGQGLRSFYGMSAGGYEFLNNGSSSPTSLPMTMVSQSDAFNRRTTSQGLFRQSLSVERTISFGPNDAFLAVDVRLTNNGSSAVNEVSWMEAIDANQGFNLDNRGPNTQNDIVDGVPYMRSSVVTNAFGQGVTMAMGAPASDSRAMATFVDPNALVIRDPNQVLAFGVNDPDGASGNLVMVLAYDLGAIGAGQSTTMRYFIFFGASPTAAQGLYDAVNAGTGSGHLTADTANPAVETLSDGSSAPTLPYRSYYPEGFASPFIYTFVPMLNPHDQPTRVFAIARYETGQRDQVLADFVIAPQSRGGITLNTPEMYDIGFGNPGGSLVRPLEPYAIELRSERPIAATFSHYDTFLLDGLRSAIGDSFVSDVSQTWTTGEVEKADGIFDIIIFQSVSDITIKIETTLLPSDGGNPIVLTQELAPFRRGGWNLSSLPNVPDGRYGVLIQAQAPIVAAVSSYDNGVTTDEPGAKGFAATPGLGATSGVTPEGQFGINAESERVGIANPNNAQTTVVFSFLFENGSAYRTSLTVPALSRGEINVGSLPGFPQGRAYAILFESPLPVTLSLPTAVFNDGNGTTFATESHTYWAFGDGFRPQDPFSTNVVEYLRLFNPTQQDQVVEITIRFDGNFAGTSTPLGQEVFRRVLPARRLAEFDVHEFVTGDRRMQDVFYGLTIKSPSGIVAYMGHYDAFFPGAFGTLGVPLGITGTI